MTELLQNSLARSEYARLFCLSVLAPFRHNSQGHILIIRHLHCCLKARFSSLKGFGNVILLARMQKAEKKQQSVQSDFLQSKLELDQTNREDRAGGSRSTVSGWC